MGWRRRLLMRRREGRRLWHWDMGCFLDWHRQRGLSMRWRSRERRRHIGAMPRLVKSPREFRCLFSRLNRRNIRDRSIFWTRSPELVSQGSSGRYWSPRCVRMSSTWLTLIAECSLQVFAWRASAFSGYSVRSRLVCRILLMRNFTWPSSARARVHAY